MKKLISIIILILAADCFPQAIPYNYYLTGLRGLEDSSGNTHLFYTLYKLFKNPDYYLDNNSVEINHLNISKRTDSSFLLAGYTYSLPYSFGKSIADFEFWDNDPAKYIYGGDNGGMDPNPYMVRYDHKPVRARGILGVTNIEISKQNDSLLYSSSGYDLYKSTNYGTDMTLVSKGFWLLSLSPFNDSTLFGLSGEGYLVRSTDGGKTSTVVDTTRLYYESIYTDFNDRDIHSLYFDRDSLHVYRLLGRHLNISSKAGSQNSFSNVFSGRRKLYLAPDYKKSGRVYIAEGRYIYVSDNFGFSRKMFNHVDRNIIGLYAKPGSDIVYAATKYGIFEVRPDSVKAVKTLAIPPDILKFYPLAKGNKWIYSFIAGPENPPRYVSVMTREVAGDTVMPNGKKYFFIKQVEPYPAKTYTIHYERIDSLTGKVYRYLHYTDNKAEVLLDDLTASIGDTVYSGRFSGQTLIPTFFKKEDSVVKWNRTFPRKRLENSTLGGSWTYDLAQGLGISYILVWWEFSGCDTYDLQGCIINGVSYGDTNYTVGVNDNLPVSRNFQLFQNYPNPFNPSTLIKYNLPNTSFVSLKVYDALGHTVADLVEEEQPSGTHEVIFPKQGSQLHLSSGIYFYTIKASGHTETRKMLFVK